MMKTIATLIVALLALSGSLLFAQGVKHEFQLREVRKLSVRDTNIPSELRSLDNGGGVIGIQWACDPSAQPGRVTPFVVLMSAPKAVRLSDAFEVEIAIINVCDRPIDVPVSTAYVVPKTKDPQYMAILKLQLASEDERFDLVGQEYLFGATDQPSTLQRLMRNEYITVRMSVRSKLTGEAGTVGLSAPATVSISPSVQYWERNSDRANGGVWGPLPAATMGGSWKKVTITAAAER